MLVYITYVFQPMHIGHIEWLYIYNTQNYLEKHNRKKKGTHNLANIIDIQSCPLSILATDPNIHRYTQHETLVNKVRK